VFRILELPPDRTPTRELFLSIVHPDDVERIEAVFAAAVAGRRPYSVTHRLVMPDGRVKFVEQQAEIVVSADGTPAHARGTTQDITERVRVAEALRASEASLRRAEVLAGLGHFQCDENGGLLECSEGLTRLLACDAATIPTLAHLTNRIHPDDRDAYQRTFAEARAAGRPFDGTFRVPQPDGPSRTLRTRGEFLPDALSGGVRFFSTAVDITELKAAERRLADLNDTLELRVANRTRDLESSNQELEAFSYAVSHDLRAPLRAIEGFAHAVMDSDASRLSPDGLAALGRVRAAARRMGTLIDALLQLAHTFREPMVKLPVDLTALVRSVLEEVEQTHPSCRPRVTVAEGLATVGDPRQLRVAFMNLLDNAFKFSSRADAPAIEVGARRIAGREVLFVRDNGVGFDMAYVDKLFRPFERLHSPADFPGTGIGLATVQRVARRHGGSAWAESAPDRGATIYLVLDAEADDRAASA
jgi:PAS domain S-box-containing protein